VKWFKDRRPINKDQYEQNWQHVGALFTSTLYIPDVNTDDTGMYRALVGFQQASEQTKEGKLTVWGK